MTLLSDGGGAKRIGGVAQIIPNRLYFTSYESPPQDDTQTVYYWLNSDEDIHYDAFYDDFGPLNLSVLYRFCQSLNKLLKQEQRRKVVIASDCTHRSRVNGAYLVASYMIIYHKLTADQTYLRVQAVEPPKFIGFRDAALGPPSYLLHLQHVVKSIEKALQLKWLDFNTFDPVEYEFYERVENGDLNWIVPNKILSFCGPHEESRVENGYPYHSPDVYFDYFRSHNVTTIIRLNKKIYQAKKFTEAGFEHRDLFFVDGSTPNDDIVRNFIDIVDSTRGAVAIHCKAGLGRTGTLIACWMMKNFKLTAPQCMAWLRVCRPGSVIGPQQQFLIEKQAWCWRMGSSADPSPPFIHPPLKQHIAIRDEQPTARVNIPNSSLPNKPGGRMLNRVTAELDECGLCSVGSRGEDQLNQASPVDDAIANRKSGKVDEANANIAHVYPIRSRLSGTNLNEVNGNGSTPYDETAINAYGQSQGDRLCEMKARVQHHREHAASPPPLQAMPTLISLEGQSTNTTPTRTAPPIRFSSDTTPIKQMRLSATRVPPVTSVFKTSGAPKPFPAFRNINFSERTPISKVTVGVSSTSNSGSSNTRASILRGNLSKQKLATARNRPYLTAVQHHTTRPNMNNDFLLDIHYANSGQMKSFLANPTPPRHLMNANSSISGTIAAAAISIANKKYGLRPRNLIQISPPKSSR